MLLGQLDAVLCCAVRCGVLLAPSRACQCSHLCCAIHAALCHAVLCHAVLCVHISSHDLLVSPLLISTPLLHFDLVTC